MSGRTADAFSLRDVGEADGALLDRLYRDVLAGAFPPDELDDAATAARGLRDGADPRVRTTVAVDAEGRVVGGIVGEVYASAGVALFAYVAVRPELRGHGIGTALVRHAVPRWSAEPGVHVVLAEVHDPRAWAGADEDPAGRLRLFGRLGARLLAVPFVQPALGPGRARSRGFLLLAFAVDAAVETRDGGTAALRSDVVSRFVRRYFETAEGAREPYDPELAGLLAAIDEPSAIALLAVDEYARVPSL